MADLYFYDGGIEDGDDGDGGGVYGDPETHISPDEPPVSKLEKYAESANIFNRQIVAKTILETLRVVTDEPTDVDAVLNVMNRLADDPEPGVRAELMEQVPHIAMYCQEFKQKLSQVVPEYLLPMVVKFLNDDNNQVRKTSQAALLVLLEQGLVEKSDVQEQVCPVIIKLTEENSKDDYRTEAVALLSKMAPLIGKEMSEQIFLDRFATLCRDPLFHVRKVCAANFGDFSTVVGADSTENVLLPKFFYLCEDGVWGVRKACADAFMPVSCVCSPAVRHSELSPLFINLLQDESRWVKIAAFQALGHFISTFADNAITGLLHNDNGEIVISDPELLAMRLDELEVQRAGAKIVEQTPQHEAQNEKCADVVQVTTEEEDSCDDATEDTVIDENSMVLDEEEVQGAKMVVNESSDISFEEVRAKSYETKVNCESSNIDSFNHFQYWREPLPELIDEDQEVPEQHECEGGVVLQPLHGEDDDTTASNDSGSSTMEMFRPNYHQDANMSTFDPYETYKRSANQGADMTQDPALPKGPPLTIQHIVPQPLIDHYVSMTDPSRVQTIDNEIAKHCAYSLPAVALTLGRSNWPLIKDTYETLAKDMQWKVRRTLASSIHELGIILGDGAQELIPVFNGFLKDLDEVRIGLLKHLADFLKLLNEQDRREYLPRLAEFLKMDNERNWRYRQELAEQLGYLVDLYTPAEVEEYLCPIAQVLVRDKVAAVRQSAVEAFTIILRHLLLSGIDNLATQVMSELGNSLVDRWVHRQTYASLCFHIYCSGAMDTEHFADEILPYLVHMAWDKVPNVRLVVARSIYHISQSPYYGGHDFPNCEGFREAMSYLAGDSDADVRAFFNPVPSSTTEYFDSDGEPIGDVSSLPV